MNRTLLTSLAMVAATTTGCGGFIRGFAEGYAESSNKSLRVEVGECLFEEPAVSAAGTIEDLEEVSCDEPHFAEAYDSLIMVGDEADYPGLEAADTESVDFCVAAFASFVGMPYRESQLEIFRFFPTEDTWADGDREILCLVLDPAGQTTGTLRAAGR